MSQESSVGASATVAQLDGLYEPASDVVVELVEGELVLLDLQRNEVFGLNEVGATLWEALSSGRTPREAVGAVLEAFDVDEQTARGDVAELLETLLSKGLVRRR